MCLRIIAALIEASETVHSTDTGGGDGDTVIIADIRYVLFLYAISSVFHAFRRRGRNSTSTSLSGSPSHL